MNGAVLVSLNCSGSKQVFMLKTPTGGSSAEVVFCQRGLPCDGEFNGLMSAM
jgi:hypothetical protein